MHLGGPLDRAGDAYIVRRGKGKTIIAGYPWFTDWGRDTFIALRGLCLATGRLEDARAILLEWAGLVSEGMLPNRFVEGGDAPEFNSVDASLWYVIAVHEYLQRRRRRREARRLPSERREPRTGGRRPFSPATPPAPATASGWMRTACSPRASRGCSSPGWMPRWATGSSPRASASRSRCRRCGSMPCRSGPACPIAGSGPRPWLPRRFRTAFWNPAGYLNDVADADGHPGASDASFRPNQIFAIGGLPDAGASTSAHGRQIVDAVEARLWTPMGLRSLAPGEPGYAPRYDGGPVERDGAYHQGTVWPWLAGPFIEAWVRVRGDTAEAREEARRRFFEPLLGSCSSGAGPSRGDRRRGAAASLRAAARSRPGPWANCCGSIG